MAVDQVHLGKWLATMRERAGLTQAQAAARLEKGEGMLSKWERGALRMSAESFFACVVLYGAVAELPSVVAKWVRATARSGAVERGSR